MHFATHSKNEAKSVPSSLKTTSVRLLRDWMLLPPTLNAISRILFALCKDFTFDATKEMSSEGFAALIKTTHGLYDVDEPAGGNMLMASRIGGLKFGSPPAISRIGLIRPTDASPCFSSIRSLNTITDVSNMLSVWASLITSDLKLLIALFRFPMYGFACMEVSSKKTRLILGVWIL